MAPQVFADRRPSIAKGGFILAIPTGLANRQFGWVKHLGHNRHQAEDTEEARRGAFAIVAAIPGLTALIFFSTFMTVGAGVDLIGGWFGTGADRGIAIVFTLAGIIGLIVTLIAMNTKYYGLLGKRCTEENDVAVLPEGEPA
jgi:hypothetical protein